MVNPRSPEDIHRVYLELRRRSSARDSRWADVKSVRDGQIELVYPDLASDQWPRSIVSNFINARARDFAELMAPLPAFNCVSSNMGTESARKRADKRTKIANSYVSSSRLSKQELTGCDQYITYGMKVYYVEPDFENKAPKITIENPYGGYPEFDRFDRLVSYTKRIQKPAGQLAAEYPHLHDKIMKPNAWGTPERSGSDLVEVIRYCDDKQITLIWCDDHPEVLSTFEHKLGEVPMEVVLRPGLDDEIHGQWDDVLWVQIARDYLAKLNLEAVEKSVRAPLGVPPDVTDVPYGPDAIIRTSAPERIRRVGVDVPQTAFLESQLLDKELHDGSRSPQGRDGDISASTITGRGIQALMGTIDTQVKAAQTVFADGYSRVIRLCFLMDETYWGSAKKTIRGHSSTGAPYELTYSPKEDIAADYTVDVTYGLMAGLDPNRWLVFALQAQGAGLLSKDTLMRHLPMQLDVMAEESRMAVESGRQALMQSIFGYAQAIPVMAQSGGDPADVVAKMAQFISDLQKGKTVEDAASKAFPPPPPPPEVGGAGLPPEAGGGLPGMGADPGLGAPPGMQESGLLDGVAHGQAGLPPGGRPDMRVLLAGLNPSGNASLSVRNEKRVPM